MWALCRVLYGRISNDKLRRVTYKGQMTNAYAFEFCQMKFCSMRPQHKVHILMKYGFQTDGTKTPGKDYYTFAQDCTKAPIWLRRRTMRDKLFANLVSRSHLAIKGIAKCILECILVRYCYQWDITLFDCMYSLIYPVYLLWQTQTSIMIIYLQYKNRIMFLKLLNWFVFLQ